MRAMASARPPTLAALMADVTVTCPPEELDIRRDALRVLTEDVNARGELSLVRDLPKVVFELPLAEARFIAARLTKRPSDAVPLTGGERDYLVEKGLLDWAPSSPSDSMAS